MDILYPSFKLRKYFKVIFGFRHLRSKVKKYNNKILYILMDKKIIKKNGSSKYYYIFLKITANILKISTTILNFFYIKPYN